MDDVPLTPDEVSELRKMIEIERIRKKKLLYSQLIDIGDSEGFADLYTEHALAEWGPYGTWRGRDQILEQLRIAKAESPQFDSLHMTTNLWIELTGPDSATSRCYLHDVVTQADPRTMPTVWFAVYEEDWVKVQGDWKINHHRIFFLWPSREAAEKFAAHMVPTAIG